MKHVHAKGQEAAGLQQALRGITNGLLTQMAKKQRQGCAQTQGKKRLVSHLCSWCECHVNATR